MGDEFTRTRSLLGEAAMKRLEAARVAVFGVGGVGGHAAEAIVRSGVGTLDIFDSDDVDVSNINRQIIALQDTVGRGKADVMMERALAINPKITVNAYRRFYLPSNADSFDLGVYSYIIDAVDTVTAKLELAVRAQAAGVPIISCMGTGNKLHPELLEIGDIYQTSVCPLARVMRRELKKRGVERLKVVYSKEPPVKPKDIIDGNMATPGSTAFVPAAAGLIAAGEVVRYIISEQEA